MSTRRVEIPPLLDGRATSTPIMTLNRSAAQIAKPTQSNGGTADRFGGTTRAAMTKATTPRGRLSKKIQCQLATVTI
ncbi:hypothetical protein [Microlunatus antarcticus]|uniref:Uncharacterized protein n=1 Tax=Microlunatus antarcticus TaxID=53388 RepID=A0A7W5JU77_9ACTN|nr:hypothetical protein [Microlunatus antarcticus]MBB3326424.1 hypothetical protein [Microlunatus antarcticus]